MSVNSWKKLIKPCCDQSSLMERCPKFRYPLLQYKNARCWMYRNPKPRGPERSQITKVCDSLEETRETREVSSLSKTFVPSRPIAWRYLTWRPLGWSLFLWHLGTSFRSAFKQIEDTKFMHPELGTWDVLILWHLGSWSNFDPTKYKKEADLFLGCWQRDSNPRPFGPEP